MSAARNLHYSDLPQGAQPSPVAVYDAAPSGMGGANGMPIMAMPTIAANEQRFDVPVNTASLPPEYVQWMQPPAMEGAAGGQLGNLGVQVGSAVTGIAASTPKAMQMLGGAASKVVSSGVGDVALGAGAGGVITAGFDAWSGARDRKDAMVQMVQMYTPVIAEQMEEKLGRPVLKEEINEDALRLVAKDNKVIAEALQAYDDGVTTKPLISGVSAGAGAVAGSTAGAALLTAAGLANPAGWAVLAAGAAASIATGIVTGKALNTLVKPEDIKDTVHGKILELKEKADSGQGLSAKDVFSLHARMNGNIQTRMNDKFGERDFDKLSEDKQIQVMAEYKNEMPLMQQEAFLINNGYLRAEMAAFVPLNAVAASMVPTRLPEAALPMTPPVMQIETSGAQVAYMQPRALAQNASNDGAFAASLASQRAGADVSTQRT